MNSFVMQRENLIDKIKTLNNLIAACLLAPTGTKAIEMLVAAQEILSSVLAMIRDSRGISLATISLEACDEISSTKFSLDMDLYLELLANGTNTLGLLRSIKSEEELVESDLPTELFDVTPVLDGTGETKDEAEDLNSADELSQLDACSCLICLPNEVFSGEEELLMHLRSQHVTISSDGYHSVHCPVCESFAVRLTPLEGDDYHNTLKTAHECVQEHLSLAHSAQCLIPNISGCDEECVTDGDEQNEVQGKRKREKKGGGVCRVCGKTLRTNLSMHVRLVHMKEAKLKCPRCGKCYSYKRDLNQHLFTAHGLNPENRPVFSCSQCPYKALRKFYYDRHLQTNHLDSKKAKAYQCELCGKSFNTQTSLNCHLKQHRTIEKKPCPHCQFRGRNASVVKHHINTVHNNIKTLGCAADCGYHAGFTSTLSNHQKKCPTFKKFISTAWDESQNGFKCPTSSCEYITYFKAQFLMHYSKCKKLIPKPGD
ncbi:hypothetical protein CAPTEDRAFT_219100 [Capitella teleta]|uniref:C2H2-type domain-containing protein n=1 Tax=Capitella teleta TaxID=283909 RepID=R7TVN1_CAPTE|nr:hypothetical protein CAPTEDRAFT_219100 [Capitella teleta]|eukprot:ELT95521.1 hypothetical protein CAPTEDRAFT_219100 [Capitella teleta]